MRSTKSNISYRIYYKVMTATNFDNKSKFRTTVILQVLKYSFLKV